MTRSSLSLCGLVYCSLVTVGCVGTMAPVDGRDGEASADGPTSSSGGSPSGSGGGSSRNQRLDACALTERG
jgi:hypothetical protein